ncbi:hypothetical protein [Cardinium endosymbiont of Bemisia tabaci]|uniref:hypothetical protein n=1 Tax=Cardinium endosymbiont of Bemisia tabaci TaxID=672794 RepID=UPI00054D9103|nr:hypothetical protein [Cardinium endosymbiont of Bemisia tabaci]
MKKFTFQFFIAFSCLFSGCTKDFRAFLAGDPKWVPRNISSFSTAQGVQPILAERVPLVLNIKMDADWNSKNRPAPLDRWETYEVNEKVINFLVKDVRVDGGSGKLFFRYEKDGKELLGAQVEDGTKLKCGDTKLFYVPDTNESCRTHNIHILCKILTVNYGKEAGKMHDFSIKLGEPNYSLNFSTEAKIAYVQDKEGTPIELSIESDNKLAELQKYKIVKSTITGGKGRIYIEGLDGVKKPICGNEPIQFGTTKLFYKPSLEEGNEEEHHKIHLTIGNSRGHITQESSIEFKVQDHIISDFEAKITIDSQDKLLLPYKEQS